MKTMILIPCMDMVHTVFMQSILMLDRRGHEVIYAIHKGSLIYDSRNRLLDAALKSDADRLLWLDSDMYLPMDTLQVLSGDIDDDHQIVSGLYFQRKGDFPPVIYKSCRLDRLPDGRIDPVAEQYRDYPDGDLFEVDAIGFGCVLMTMEAVRTIVSKYGHLPFMPVGGFGEDLSFCLRAREAGVRIWCDSRVRLGHVGLHTYDEHDYLEAMDHA